jgi:hypothetical protein
VNVSVACLVAFARVFAISGLRQNFEVGEKGPKGEYETKCERENITLNHGLGGKQQKNKTSGASEGGKCDGQGPEHALEH